MSFYLPGTKLRKRLGVVTRSRQSLAFGSFDAGQLESQKSNEGSDANRLFAIAVRPMSVELNDPEP